MVASKICRMLFKIYCKCNEIVIIILLFLLHSLYKLCFLHKFKKARFYYNFFIYSVTWLAVCSLYYPIFKLRGRNLENAWELLGVFEYLGERILGLQITVRNSKVLMKDQAAVIITNHQSSLEMQLFLQIWRKTITKLIGVTKKEVRYIFPFGNVHHLMGTMFVSRDKGGINDMDKVGIEVVKEKAKALIMPEGTRNRNREIMLPFKRGAFHMAIKSQIPIIPVTTSPFYFIDYDKPSFEQPRVIMQVLDEVSTVGLTLNDVTELKERVQKQMWETYQKLYHECMGQDKNQDNDEYDCNGYTIVE
ncbi:unnamed protein product [Diatraea saccharalis]|uniref:1-acylglycerol-3-phosphate O-acyltransferase n=1 Tax=Diatraea saccharalis TaxID=40085 RepID=A0A9N9W4R0_9NEOP|nr:unnamed protein product [Diatraea saccharalis]